MRRSLALVGTARHEIVAESCEVTVWILDLEPLPGQAPLTYATAEVPRWCYVFFGWEKKQHIAQAELLWP